MIKKLIPFLFLILAGCKSEKDVVCSNPIMTNGNMRVVSSQCVAFGSSATGFIEIENTNTKQHFMYTVNWVDDHIIFNLDTSKMITMSKAQEAADNSAMAVGMAAASIANSGGRK